MSSDTFELTEERRGLDEEWLEQCSALWNSLKSSLRLAALQPGDEDGLDQTMGDAIELKHLLLRPHNEPWRVTSYVNLWSVGFSGMAAVTRDCQRLAQLAQQQVAALQAADPDGGRLIREAAFHSLHALVCPLSCLQQCPLEYLHSMPAAQQQQLKTLSQFFLTAGPQLLLDGVAAERGKEGRDGGGSLAWLGHALQQGMLTLLQPPLTSLLEVSAVKAGLGRWLDALEVATKEGHLCVSSDCSLFGVDVLSATDQGGSYDPDRVLLEVAAAKTSRAALAFRHYASRVYELDMHMELAFSRPDVDPDFVHPGLLTGIRALVSIIELGNLKKGLLPEAAKLDADLFDELCSALSMAGPLELSIRRPASMVGPLDLSAVLKTWALAWEACAAKELQQHASLLYIQRLLASAASMTRIATALSRWQQEGRLDDESLPEMLSHVWTVARQLARQAYSCSERLASGLVADPRFGHPPAHLAALQHALCALGEAITAWQWWHSSSGRAAWDTLLDPRESLRELSRRSILTVASLLPPLLDSDLQQQLFRDHRRAAVGVVSLALQVQVKAVQALEVGSWGDFLKVMVFQLSFCLPFTLKLASGAALFSGRGESAADDEDEQGRLLPAGPYLHIIPAVQTLIHLEKQLPSREILSDTMPITERLAEVLCWLLIHRGNHALLAGAGQLLRHCCTAPQRMLPVLRDLRAGQEDAAALGAIPLLGAAAEFLCGVLQTQVDLPLKRQLSIDGTKLLKRCCTVVDAAAGTSFAAIDAGIEAEGAQLMRDLIGQGQPGAADAVRTHVWERRRVLLLPRIEYVVRQGLQVMACVGTVHCSSNGSGNGGDSSSGSSSQVPLCPQAVLSGALEMAAGKKACSRPTCCTVLVAEGSKLLVCRGCQVARYCSASCAQADWERHRPVCQAIRGLGRRDDCEMRGKLSSRGTPH